MSLRLKPVSFADTLYYEDESQKGTVMVDDYPDGRGWTSDKSYRERLCGILKGEEVEVLDEFTVQDNRNSIIKLRQTMEPDIDAIVTQGTNLWLPLARVANLGKPILFDGGRFLKGFLQSVGCKLYIADDENDLKRMVKVLGVRKRLWDTNALIFGEIPSLVPSNLWDFPTIRSQFGVGFRQIENRELLEKQEAISQEEAQRTLNEWMKGVEEVVEPREEELLEVAKVYLAIKEILHKNSASALGINCARLTEIKFIPPCWAMAHLIDEGIPTVCSADINTLIVMTILMYLSKGPAIMGNFNVNIQKKRAFISHDVIPSKMTKGKFKLYQYHYRGKGVTAYADVKEGTVTIAGLRTDLRQIFVTTGKVISSRNTGHCRITIEIEVQHPEAIREFICADHYPMVYGDYSKELETLGKIMDIEVLKL